MEAFSVNCENPSMSNSSTASDTPSVARRLEQLRKAIGMSQVEFCELTGIGKTAWNNYERARARISLNEALKVRTKTGATLDWIYAGDQSGLPVQLAKKLQAASYDSYSTEPKAQAG